MNSTHFEIRSF